MGADRLRISFYLYLGLLTLVSILLHFFADRWWPATVIMYGPRWVWLLPFALFIPVSIVRNNRRLLSISLVSLTFFFFVITGFQLPVYRNFQETGSNNGTIRVLTYNIAGLKDKEFLEMLESYYPDIAVLQENNLTNNFYFDLRDQGWHVYRGRAGHLLSRYPFQEKALSGVNAFGNSRDKAAMQDSLYYFEITTPQGSVHIVDIHLPTPRIGFLQLLAGNMAKSVVSINENIQLRTEVSAKTLQQALRLAEPFIILGDFNLPVESRIYQENWGRYFRNAFDEAGFGIGITRPLDWWGGVRIDHLLLSKDWSVNKIFVGRDQAIDHRPVIADLFLVH